MPGRGFGPYAGMGWRHVFVVMRDRCGCPWPQHFSAEFPNPYCSCGARKRGGRFNPEGFPVLYLCLTPECSAMEFLSHPPHIFPRHLYRYGINIENVLDPTGSEGRSLVRTSETVIRGPRGSDTQSVGMRAHGLGYNAIRSFSATGEGETLTVFPDRVVLDVDVIVHEMFDVWHNLEDVERVAVN